MVNTVIKTISKDETAELIEKKSKFIANIYAVESVKEAESKIKDIKKKYHDARHNCYAYSVMENGQTVVRMSDDGEPSGTAGEPILNVILKNELQNVLIIVTRYFGGILLGTGGLTRAYSNISIQALKNTDIIEKEEGIQLEVGVNYADNAKFKYYCSKNNIKIIDLKYKENIFYIIELNEEKFNNLKKNNKEKNRENVINIISIVEKCRKLIEKVK